MNIMKCPICNVALVVADKQGVEVDYCPQCRGIWLDRGELEKIIDRSNSFGFSREHHDDDHDNHDRHNDYNRTHDEHHGDSFGQGYPHKRKKGFLSDLFDF
jgi:Zn-finger nucleic acid-binding protein